MNQDFAEGSTLFEAIQTFLLVDANHRPILDLVLSLFADLASGLAHLNDQGLRHGDLRCGREWVLRCGRKGEINLKPGLTRESYPLSAPSIPARPENVILVASPEPPFITAKVKE